MNTFNKEKDEELTSTELFEIFRRHSERVNWDEQVQEDIEFINNIQIDQEVKSALEAANMPADPLNVLKPTRDQAVQQLTDSDPRWQATGRENSDTKTASEVADLMSYIWDISKGRSCLTKAVEDFEDTGLFVMMAYYDKTKDWGKGDICITDIDPRKVYFPPNTTRRDARDASDIIVADVLKKEEIRLKYPDFKFPEGIKGCRPEYLKPVKSDSGIVITPSSEMYDDYYLVVNHYKKVNEKRYLVNDGGERLLNDAQLKEYLSEEAMIVTKIGDETIVTDKQEIEYYKNIVAQYGDIFHYMSDGSIMKGFESSYVDELGNTAIPNSTVKITFVTKEDLLNEGRIHIEEQLVPRIKLRVEIGEILYYEDTLPISNYPFGITMLHHNRNPYPYGDARIAKPYQKQINKAFSLIIAHNINNTNVKVFIPEGDAKLRKEMEERWGKAGAQFFEFDAEVGQPPIIVYPGQMPVAFYEQIDRLILLVQKTYGVYEFQEGLIKSAPQTKGGTALIDQAGFRRSSAKLKLIEEALNNLAEVVAELIPYVYTEEKIIRIVRPNGKVKETVFNKQVQTPEGIKVINDISSAKYDIKLVSGSTMLSNKWLRYEILFNAYQSGVLRDPTPLIYYLDIPDIDEILEREDMLKNMQGQMMQLEEENKMLKGQLQTKVREVIQANERVEKEKTKTKLNKIVNKAESTVELSREKINQLIKSGALNNKSQGGNNG